MMTSSYADCDKFTLNCMSKDGDFEKDCGTGAGGCAHKRSCRIVVKKEYCDSVNWLDQQELPLESALDQIKKLAVKNFHDAFVNCLFVHEIHHLDNADDDVGGYDETVAYNNGSECLRDYFRQFCSSASPRWPAAECKKLDARAASEQVAKFVNHCRARGRNWKACFLDCYEKTMKLHAQTQDAAQSCDNSVRLYMGSTMDDFDRIVLKQLVDKRKVSNPLKSAKTKAGDSDCVGKILDIFSINPTKMNYSKTPGDVYYCSPNRTFCTVKESFLVEDPSFNKDHKYPKQNPFADSRVAVGTLQIPTGICIFSKDADADRLVESRFHWIPKSAYSPLAQNFEYQKFEYVDDQLKNRTVINISDPLHLKSDPSAFSGLSLGRPEDFIDQKSSQLPLAKIKSLALPGLSKSCEAGLQTAFGSAMPKFNRSLWNSEQARVKDYLKELTLSCGPNHWSTRMLDSQLRTIKTPEKAHRRNSPKAPGPQPDSNSNQAGSG